MTQLQEQPQKQSHQPRQPQERSCDSPDLRSNVCRDFMRNKCTRTKCNFIHDVKLCHNYWKNGSCKFKHNCRKNHFVTTDTTFRKSTDTDTNPKKSAQQKPKRKKNTECFEPLTHPVDMRIVYDTSSEKMTTNLSTRDVLLAPNVFSDFPSGKLYTQLLDEINNCGVPEKDLLKLWHGNNVIPGTHLICNDRTHWKDKCPTFQMIVDRIRDYFSMDIQATRFNWYTDTSQWKPFHHDSAYVNPDKAAVQNFTVAVSFGATRDAAFEHASTKTVISLPQPDGCVYAFSKDTNAIWRHGILQDTPVRNEGRISIICWGKVNDMFDPANS